LTGIDKDNLYKLWNRLSSGSYFPQPVREVEIPKGDGKKRKLGIPTVSDRIAQTAVAKYLEQKVEPHFHPDSYGYRPNKSALEAVGMARERCWRYSWVLELDIQGFFDNLDRNLVMKAVRTHTDTTWVLLYLERWFKAPVEKKDGTQEEREKGTVQGSPISPVLANLFLHYALDKWLQKTFPECPFERYADDAVIHCRTEAEAQKLKSALAERLEDCELKLHPEKTQIVYCKYEARKGDYPRITFDFLGYTFGPRSAKTKHGRVFNNFLPAASRKVKKAITQEIRRWKLQRKTDKTIEDMSSMYAPILRGWINYYGKYGRSALSWILYGFNRKLIKWAERKYKTQGRRKAAQWLRRIADKEPQLFPHWMMGIRPSIE
jgi:RNA-directed DNA polymerase